MSYETILTTMQQTDKALRVCLGTPTYKKVFKLSQRMFSIYTFLFLLRNFLMGSQNAEMTIKDAIAAGVEIPDALYMKINKDKTVAVTISELSRDATHLRESLFAILDKKSGARELYQRTVESKESYALAHQPVRTGNPTEEQKERYRQYDLAVSEADLLLGEVGTYEQYNGIQREIFSLTLIAQNYSAEGSKLNPEVVVLQGSSVWEYVGVGVEPIERRVNDLVVEAQKYLNVPGFADLATKIQTLSAL